MKDEHAQFSGSIPAAYDRYLGPMLFQPYAEDLAARLQVEKNGSVLELSGVTSTAAPPDVHLRWGKTKSRHALKRDGWL